ncbi:hypothetical protein [Legionella yabuuchiae]|uniref:hypothetical protein n=1 Tax=Legionella yabuuchiae TaxID=376727 RepID=UPI0010568168|nr:hypothetical protein [Legionella yabuuchiae]
MSLIRGAIVAGAIFFALATQANAKETKDDYYRNFWNPKYHAELLDYCSFDKTQCGIEIANRYCQMMGYKKATQEIIANNVGLTHFLGAKGGCKGWECDGFKLIRCEGTLSDDPPKLYSYRYRRFVYPRFDHYRIDWCYETDTKCGRRAAYSYCRRLGYLDVKEFKKEAHVAATKALGNQKLCFGQHCSGFKYITCYR